MAKKAQIDKFREAARALEADEDAGKFDRSLGQIAKQKPIGRPEDEGEKQKPKAD